MEDREMTEPVPTAPAAPPAKTQPLLTPRVVVGIIAACGLAFLLVMLFGGLNQASDDKKDDKKDEKKDDEPRKKIAAPDLDGGVAWLNTGGPLSMKDLKGKVV